MTSWGSFQTELLYELVFIFPHLHIVKFHSSCIFTCHSISWSTIQERILQSHKTARLGKVKTNSTPPSNYNESQLCQTNDMLLQETEKFLSKHFILNTSFPLTCILATFPHTNFSPLHPCQKTNALCKWTRKLSHTSKLIQSKCATLSAVSALSLQTYNKYYITVCANFPLQQHFGFPMFFSGLLSK